MTQNNKSISPLRQRMLEDMTMRKLSPMTQTAYIRVVKNFTLFLGRSPDSASADSIRANPEEAAELLRGAYRRSRFAPPGILSTLLRFALRKVARQR